MKIIGISNFNLETVDDILVEENVEKADGELKIQYLNGLSEDQTYFFKLVDDNYELYQFEP